MTDPEQKVSCYHSVVHNFIFELNTSGSSPGLPQVSGLCAARPEGTLTVDVEGEQNITRTFTCPECPCQFTEFDGRRPNHGLISLRV